MALFVVQISLLISGFIWLNASVEDVERGYAGIEDKWHQDAGGIKNGTEDTVMQLFKEWKQAYPEASMFWVNDNGHLSAELNVTQDLPAEWDPVYTAEFIKERYDGNPYTVVAFLGQEHNQGFIVFQIPRMIMENASSDKTKILSITSLVLIILFIIVSLFFFRRIRKRLLYLQKAMAVRDVDNLPVSIHVKKDDEIGQLETAFNNMVHELRESHQREQEEEQLRRELIANLSHDLRTPLTKMRAQIDTISNEGLSNDVYQAFHRLEGSIDHIDRLMENLMSYTLLTASKMKYQPQKTDILRHVRTSLAAWYPLFEQESFDIDVNLGPFEQNEWLVDPLWMDRILDNVLQNVIRYAKEGRYIGVTTESASGYDVIVITDHGPGIYGNAGEKGVGIGLSIVDMMVRQMGLDWNMESGEHGTVVRIKRMKQKPQGETVDT
ncbi:histidine kinase dimerization/phospho-acceptor domain-containing protein [Lentibacillus juripiscarius]